MIFLEPQLNYFSITSNAISFDIQYKTAGNSVWKQSKLRSAVWHTKSQNALCILHRNTLLHFISVYCLRRLFYLLFER